MINVVVEGDLGQAIIAKLISRLEIPASRFNVIATKKSLHPERIGLDRIRFFAHGRPLVVVFEQESGTIADYVAKKEDSLDTFWCPAIPQIEAWLFADDLILERISPTSSLEVVRRLPSPENIPYPKHLRHFLLRDMRSVEEVVLNMDISRAVARSPSLAYFVKIICNIFGKPFNFESPSVASRQIDRDILKALISEVYPGSKIIFRASDGSNIDANQMIKEMTLGTDLGLEYATALLRVARDFLKRQAERAV